MTIWGEQLQSVKLDFLCSLFYFLLSSLWCYRLESECLATCIISKVSCILLTKEKTTMTFRGLYGIGDGTPLQNSCLENPVDGGAWKAAVHGVVEGRTRLSDFTFTFHFHALEKEMATHSSVLAWRIPGMGEPGGLLSMGSHRVGHD